jgi:hypothetical protein
VELADDDENLRVTDADMLLADGGKSGILDWALEGLSEVIAHDWTLSLPESVREATDKYLSESDRVKQFADDNTSAKVSTKDLRLHYLAYLGGHNPKFFMTPSKFTTIIQKSTYLDK